MKLAIQNDCILYTLYRIIIIIFSSGFARLLLLLLLVLLLMLLQLFCSLSAIMCCVLLSFCPTQIHRYASGICIIFISGAICCHVMSGVNASWNDKFNDSLILIQPHHQFTAMQWIECYLICVLWTTISPSHNTHTHWCECNRDEMGQFQPNLVISQQTSRSNSEVGEFLFCPLLPWHVARIANNS